MKKYINVALVNPQTKDIYVLWDFELDRCFDEGWDVASPAHRISILVSAFCITHKTGITVVDALSNPGQENVLPLILFGEEGKKVKYVSAYAAALFSSGDLAKHGVASVVNSSSRSFAEQGIDTQALIKDACDELVEHGWFNKENFAWEVEVIDAKA